MHHRRRGGCLLIKTGPGLRWNEHIEGDGETIFRHACMLGLEGIVSNRKDSPYRSGRSPDWLKFKNPAAPAVKREGRRIGRNGDKLPHAFRLPHRFMGSRWRERHRALGWCRGPSSRDGDLRGRVPALAQGTNHLAPRLSSNRRQSPDSACVSAARTRRAFSFGNHGPMTSLESLGAFAALIFIAALIVGTAFPALLRLF